jgi:hypothetical protein
MTHGKAFCYALASRQNRATPAVNESSIKTSLWFFSYGTASASRQNLPGINHAASKPAESAQSPGQEALNV